jgi:iron complex transport system ATP-binding protein
MDDRPTERAGRRTVETAGLSGLPSRPAIRLAGVTLALGGRTVLADIDVTIVHGEFIGLLGANGAGKTTLLRALAGVLPEAPGQTPDPKRVAYLPQGARCAWGMTVRQVAALGRLPFGGGDDGAVEDALRVCGVLALADRRIDQVSGGQARRAMLARALAGRPRVLLLDEPVADLDPPSCHAIMRLLGDFAAGGGTVVAVLHALDLAAAYAGRLVVMRDGVVAADGTPAAVLPVAAEVFGMDLQAGHVPLLTLKEGLLF